jgi:hypothetical protein
MATKRLNLFLLAILLTLVNCQTNKGQKSSSKEGELGLPMQMFIEKTDAFGAEKCPSPGCWTNYLRVVDMDGDGDLDVVAVNYNDFFNGSQNSQPLSVFLNDGAGEFVDGSAMVGDHTGELRQVAIGDINGDFLPDIYAPSAIGKDDFFFVSDGQGKLHNQVIKRMPGSKSTASATRFFDADSDGDLDLYVSEGYGKGAVGENTGHIYLNDGDGHFEELADAIVGPVSGNDIDDVDVFDADGDFDLDLLLNPHNGGNAVVLINDGTGKFSVEADRTGASVAGGNHYNPAVCDFNGDRHLDIMVDNIGGGYNELLLLNDGKGVFNNATPTIINNNNGEDDNGVICADIDNDGSFDAVILSLHAAGERLLLNNGEGILKYRPNAFRQFKDGTLWGEFGDLNGDQRIDLVTAQGESGATFQNRVYFANSLVPIDDREPVIRGIEAIESLKAGEERMVRFAVSDRSVTDGGPRLKGVFVRVIKGNQETNFPATFMGGDLFRGVIPKQAEGTVAYSVCAMDRVDNLGCSELTTIDVLP